MPTILIADDNASLRRLLLTTLDPGRYVCLEAPDGDVAWRALREHRPAVALLDVQMPGRTGVELTRASRSDPGLAATRVILLSARREPEDVATGLAAGADHYLTKPFSPLALLRLLEDTDSPRVRCLPASLPIAPSVHDGNKPDRGRRPGSTHGRVAPEG
jgi:CheY-like chemotaxis protein